MERYVSDVFSQKSLIHTQMSPVYSTHKKLYMQLQEWRGMCPMYSLQKSPLHIQMNPVYSEWKKKAIYAITKVQ